MCPHAATYNSLWCSSVCPHATRYNSDVSDLEAIRQAYDDTLNVFVETMMVIKADVLGRLKSAAARRLRIEQAFTSRARGALKTFYVAEHHLAMQGGFGRRSGNKTHAKYHKDHFPSGTFEFGKGVSPA